MEINLQKEKIQDECVEKFIESNFYGAAIMATGLGKTLILLRCMSELLERDSIKSILYTCDNRDLRDTDFPNEVKKWGYSNYLKKMDRLCYQSAYKLEGKSYDLLLADEGDYSLTPEYQKLFLNNSFKYIIFVSATLSPEKLKILKSFDIPIIYTKELNEGEDEGAINKSKYYYVNFLLNDRENKQYIYYNKNIARVLNDDKEDPELELLLRNRKLFLNGLASSRKVCRELLDNIEGRKLVFSELTGQIDKICPYTYHGENSDLNYLELFNLGEIDEIGVVGKVNRGVNLHRVENVILESCSSSKTKIVQKLGRGKRLSIEEFLNVYMLVPYYLTWNNKIKPTIVKTWLETALKDFNIPNIEVFKF